MKYLSILLGIAALGLTGCLETTSPNRGAPSSQDKAVVMPPRLPPVGEYKLGKGDTVIIHLKGIEPSDSVEDIVDANGMITLPLIDEVQAAGRTTREIESAIKARYVPDYYRSINITLLVPTKTYYVEGKVQDPGKYPIRGVVRVMQAIAEAGGVDEFAHPSKVTVTRGGQVVTLDRKAMAKNPRLDVELAPGDRVYVEDTIF